MTLPETPASSRRVIALLRAALALVVLAAVAYQIIDRVRHNFFAPGEYFAYFTIQSMLMCVVVLAVGGHLAWRTTRDTKLFTIVRVSVLSYAVIACAVYNVLLRDLPSVPGYAWPVWPNEVLHVWAPILLVLDWALSPGRRALRLRASLWALLYPVAWLVFTMVRGAITGWWPYPFLNPNGVNGIMGVIVYVVGIALVIWLIAFLGLLLAKIRTRQLPSVVSTPDKVSA
ncbi:Pr6Pr family membrane protein [Alpinimonas psychrophila]|uniref:Putative membrane protein n=1 Tax=Alpinimonas psychrophila TaxID=748908 RepID=A0A7W3JV03_9MICO|nr:Pr6Pr family membrane protein [Alpinimonas psychrophila]MBA8829766.1 putative membrane protein [Alpinimonas psychrophila]